jgi:hypothetical protein
MRDFLHAVPEGIFEATLVLCPSITMERLTLEDFMTLSSLSQLSRIARPGFNHMELYYLG